MQNIRILEADLAQPAHQQATLNMVDAYSRDAMGDGKPRAANARANLIGEAVGFALPEAASVTLEVFDLRGVRLGVLSEGYRPKGYHSVRFDTRRFKGRLLIFKMEAGTFQAVRKGMLAR